MERAPRFTVRSSHIVGGMVAVIGLLGAGAWWDQRSEARSAFADFALEQVMVARAAANAIEEAASARPDMRDDAILREAATRLHALERPYNVVVLVRPPGIDGLLTLGGRRLRSAAVELRLATKHADGAWVRLTHPEAEAVGLQPRTAVAGISEIGLGRGRTWDLVVATSAHRERDREERGLWRIGLGFVIASAIVVTFGVLALRKQRTELELVKRLAVAEAVQLRDERLVKADKIASFGALAMGIAHQVATPLGVIVARVERLAPRVAGDERALKAVTAISEQAQRINHIVRSFLGVARGAAPTLERTDPAQIGRAAVDLVAHRFEKARVKVALRVAGQLPKFACDAQLFEQAVVNLLLNACDACGDGGYVTLEIGWDRGRVTFVVDDDGPGIGPEQARRATEPFFTTKPPGEGTGLGLAIAREIVQHHRGTLAIESRPGWGTRVRLEVPADGAEGAS